MQSKGEWESDRFHLNYVISWPIDLIYSPPWPEFGQLVISTVNPRLWIGLIGPLGLIEILADHFRQEGLKQLRKEGSGC